MVGVISINFLNLLLIQEGIISSRFNFFGVYSLLYGILLRRYKLDQGKDNSVRIRFNLFENILLIVISAYTVIQISFVEEPQFFGYDDLETIPGILLMLVSSFRGAIRFFRNSDAATLEKLLFGSSSVLSLLLVGEFLIDYSTSGNTYYVITLSIFLLTYIFINALIIHGLAMTKSSQFASTSKYNNSGLSEDSQIDIAEKLESYLMQSAPFLDPHYSLDLLSEDIGIPKAQISQTLSIHFKKNFFEWMNEKRALKAKETIDLDSEEKLSVKEVMYNSGFNSKSTFLKHFKNLTGHTPTEYRKLK